MLHYDMAVFQPRKMLKNLDAWLDKAEAHAEAKSFDRSVLLEARLAPDQFAFVRHIQAVCDAAKFLAARLAGVTAPSHADDEKTWEQIRERVTTVAAYLDSFEEQAFATAGERWVELPFLEGQKMRADDYMFEMALPNFYFHLVTAYAILRHNGVDLGKRDYIGSLRLEAV
jgi:hypothetical protein